MSITLKKITKINEETKKKNLRFFSKLSEEMQLEILDQQRQIFHKIRTNENYKEASNQHITLASLILAIDQYMKKMNNVKINSIKLRSKRRKENVKKVRLLQYWSIIIQLKNEEDYSFRAIAYYLCKYHKFEISHSTINNLWNEIQNKGNK